MFELFQINKQPTELNTSNSTSTSTTTIIEDPLIINYKQIDIDAVRNLAQISNNFYNKAKQEFIIPTNLEINGKLNLKKNIKFNKKNDNNFKFDIFPINTIITWSTTSDYIPKGWAICDGKKYTYNSQTGEISEDNNGTITTPNLQGRFILGSNIIGNTGGEAKVILTESQMPNHTHDINNNFSTDTNVYSSSLVSFDYTEIGNTNGHAEDNNIYFSTNNSSNNIGNMGNNKPHENRPPYYALIYIIKLV